MHHLFGVNRVDRFEQLPHDRLGLFLAQRNYAGQIIKQFAVSAQFEHQKDVGARLEHIVELDDERVSSHQFENADLS